MIETSKKGEKRNGLQNFTGSSQSQCKEDSGRCGERNESIKKYTKLQSNNALLFLNINFLLNTK